MAIEIIDAAEVCADVPVGYSEYFSFLTRFPLYHQRIASGEKSSILEASSADQAPQEGPYAYTPQSIVKHALRSKVPRLMLHGGDG